MNLVLIGYRGTGKSVVGKLLAERLQMQYLSLDASIIAKAGLTIPEIVENGGWPAFRNLESEVTREVAQRDNQVIDTGGGIIERPENIAVLQANARIIWLKASADTIIARIQNDTQRPSLTTGKTFLEEVTEVLERRIPKYQLAARYIIDTDQLSPEQVTDKIIEIWRASH